MDIEKIFPTPILSIIIQSTNLRDSLSLKETCKYMYETITIIRGDTDSVLLYIK